MLKLSHAHPDCANCFGNNVKRLFVPSTTSHLKPLWCRAGSIAIEPISLFIEFINHLRSASIFYPEQNYDRWSCCHGAALPTACLSSCVLMWRRVNLCMSQIRRSPCLHCVSHRQHFPPTLTLLTFQCLLWRNVGCFPLRMSQNSSIFVFLKQCSFAKWEILPEVSEWGVSCRSAPQQPLHIQCCTSPYRKLFTTLAVPQGSRGNLWKEKCSSWVFSTVDSTFLSQNFTEKSETGATVSLAARIWEYFFLNAQRRS